MTHHVGYTLLFEQALQVVDPSVSIPYWEYTIECETTRSRQIPLGMQVCLTGAANYSP